VLRRLFALLRRDPIIAGCLLLGAAFGILRLRGRARPHNVALGELTPEQQRLIYLRFVDGLDTSEIARIMAAPEDEVRVLQLQALRSLLRGLANRRN
jgi:Sigma-70, region 4